MNTYTQIDDSKATQRRPAPTPAHLEGFQLDAMYVFDWIEDGWRAARTQPLLWLGVALFSAAFATLCKLVPLARPLVVLVAPLVVGGLMFAQERARIGRPASVREIWGAVVGHHVELLAIGLASAAGVVLGYVLLIATLHASLVTSLMTNGVHHLSITYGGTGVRGVLATLIAVPVFTVALASAWFAPALVMLRGAAALDAMIASLHAAARNWRTTLIYVVAMTDAVLLASKIPLLASSLALMPLLLLSIYGGYRDVFASGTAQR